MAINQVGLRGWGEGSVDLLTDSPVFRINLKSGAPIPVQMVEVGLDKKKGHVYLVPSWLDYQMRLKRCNRAFAPVDGKICSFFRNCFRTMGWLFLGLLLSPFAILTTLIPGFSPKWHNQTAASLHKASKLAMHVAKTWFGRSHDFSRNLSKSLRKFTDQLIIRCAAGNLFMEVIIARVVAAAALDIAIGAFALFFCIIFCGNLEWANSRVVAGVDAFFSLFGLPAAIFAGLSNIIRPAALLNTLQMGLVQSVVGAQKMS